ncbi:MAG TPA: hypothetical protein VNZ53_18785 [Steroidobacteraceae bacterium]|nr:hypothetical protein [Steroidobacteraceae bacterium]
MTRTSELPLRAVSPDGDPQVSDSRAAIARLEQTIVELKRKIAEVEQPPARWLSLKAAAIDTSVEYETARTWVTRGLVEGRREGGRWVVNVVSLRARTEQLAGRLAGSKRPPNAPC